MSCSKVAKSAKPSGPSTAGLAQIEKDRLARIKFIQQTMREMFKDVDTSLLQKQQSVSKPGQPSKPQKRRSEPASEAELRRSNRISHQPVPLYYIEEDASESAQKRRRCSTTPDKGGPSNNGRRCHGTTAVHAGDDPYLWAPLGWKIECGAASLEAARAAEEAALALAGKLNAERPGAFVKLMSASQVSGGFWCQMPIDILPLYGTEQCSDKRVIILHCDDRARQPPDSFMYSLPGSATNWPVVYLPKSDDGGSGLSGGWRAFAIDQRINPNDTVLFVAMENAEPAAALTLAEVEAAVAYFSRLKKPASQKAEAAFRAAAAAAAAAVNASAAAGGAAGAVAAAAAAAADSNAAGSGGSASDADTAAVCSSEGSSEEQQQSEQGAGGEKHGSNAIGTAAAAAGGRVFVDCAQRLHMRVHIFRASSYETDETHASAKPQQLLATPTPAAAPAAATAADLVAAGSQDRDGQQADSSSKNCPPEGGSSVDNNEQDEEDLDADVPLAKRIKVAAAAAGADATVQQDQQPRHSLEAGGVLKPQGSGCSRLSGLLPLSPESQAVHPLGLMEAAESGALKVKVGRLVSNSPAAAAAAAAAGGCGLPVSSGKAAAAAAVAPAAEAKKQRPCKRPASTAAVAAAAAAAEAEPRFKRAAAAAASSAWASIAKRDSHSSSSDATAAADAAGSGVALVPQPVNPSVLVPGPTAAEVKRNVAAKSFKVEQIMQHRVDAKGGDEFLIRWQHFGPFWDSWEPLSCLHDAPGTYSWEGGEAAVPRQLRR